MLLVISVLGVFIMASALLPVRFVRGMLLFVLLAVSPYVQEGIPGLGYAGPQTSLFGKLHLSSWAAIATSVGSLVRHRFRLSVASPARRLAVLGFACGLIALFFSIIVLGTSGAALVLDNFVMPFVMLWLFAWPVMSESELASFRRLIVVFGLVNAGYSIFEYVLRFNVLDSLFQGQSWFDLDIGQRWGTYRTTGLWGHPLYASTLMLFSTVLGVTTIRSSKLRTFLLLSGLVVAMITASRFNFILIVGLVIPYVVLKVESGARSYARMLRVIVAACGALLGVWVIFQSGLGDSLLGRGFNFTSDLSVGVRLVSWRLLLSLSWTEHLLGGGLGAANTFAALYGFPMGMENPYLALLLNLGLIVAVFGCVPVLVFSYWVTKANPKVPGWLYVIGSFVSLSSFTSFSAKTTLLTLYVLLGYFLTVQASSTQFTALAGGILVERSSSAPGGAVRIDTHQ